MTFPLHLPDLILFSIDPYDLGDGEYAYEDFRLIANRLREGKRVKCRIISPIYFPDDPDTRNMSKSVSGAAIWKFTGEARVEHSHKTSEEKWVKFTGWIPDCPAPPGEDEFYISPKDVDESFGDYLEDACDPRNKYPSIVITTRVTPATSRAYMPYD